MGKTIDMAALAAKNEKTRAVGNMKVNARGDTIDSTGKVIVPVTAKVNNRYAKTVGNKSANVTKKSAAIKADPVIEEELTALEREFEESEAEAIEIEAIKAKETEKK